MDRNATLLPWRPTSLDYINRPNPIEPQSEPHKHPLNGPSRVSNSNNQDLRRLLLERDVVDSADGRPSKRRKSGAGSCKNAEDVSVGSLDLPRLPVRSGTKRMRIPPTLSGLHQPPPDARLLPSILVDQPPKSVASTSVETVLATPPATAATDITQTESRGTTSKPGKTKRNKWSTDETACLLKGVAQFGVGSWTKILECSEYHFDSRTALDLRDRFRVCRPQDYTSVGEQASSNEHYRVNEPEQDSEEAAKSSKPGRKSSMELRALGIDEPFAKVKRRKRTKYTPCEDRALLDGFEKHGNMWALILESGKDIFLPLRTATDLRDRFRTKFPDKYAQTGRAPRPEVFPAPPQRKKDSNPSATKARATDHDPAPQFSTSTTTFIDASSTTKYPTPSIFPPHHHDVFFGAPFESNHNNSNNNHLADEPDAHSIVLDRGILDWPNEPARPPLLLLAPATTELGRTGIDPLITLRPPGHLPSLSAATANAATPAHGLGIGIGYANVNVGDVLPPLAAITAEPVGLSLSEPLALPSLMMLDGGGRSVGGAAAASGVSGVGGGAASSVVGSVGISSAHLMNIEDMLM